MCSLGWGRNCFIHLPIVSKDFPAALPFDCKVILVCERKISVKPKFKKFTDRISVQIPNDGLTLPGFLPWEREFAVFLNFPGRKRRVQSSHPVSALQHKSISAILFFEYLELQAF